MQYMYIGSPAQCGLCSVELSMHEIAAEIFMYVMEKLFTSMTHENIAIFLLNNLWNH